MIMRQSYGAVRNVLEDYYAANFICRTLTSLGESDP